MSLYSQSGCAIVSMISNYHKIDRNQVIRDILNKKVYDEFEEHLYSKIFEMRDIDIRKADTLHNRPVKGRKYNNCHMNAVEEWKKTGNDWITGYVIMNYGCFAHIVLHSVNYDAKTKEYYDTGVYEEGLSGWISRMFFPFYDTKQTNKKILQHFKQVENIFEDYSILTDGKRVYEVSNALKEIVSWSL